MKPRKWRGIFSDENRLVGTIEQITPTRWFVYLPGGLFLGTAMTSAEAVELIERQRKVELKREATQ